VRSRAACGARICSLSHAAHILWVDTVSMCNLSGAYVGPLMVVASAPPLALELGLLLVVCWSTLARSRATSEPLLAAFARDGALSFFVRSPAIPFLLRARWARAQLITALRALQLGLAATGSPALTLLGLVALGATWFVSTPFSLRFFAAQHAREHAGAGGARDSAPGLAHLHKILLLGSDGSAELPRAQSPWGVGADVEVGRVEVELCKDWMCGASGRFVLPQHRWCTATYLWKSSRASHDITSTGLTVVILPFRSPETAFQLSLQ
jgi:hypothetical protein